jgi:hypothetical protein
MQSLIINDSVSHSYKLQHVAAALTGQLPSWELSKLLVTVTQGATYVTYKLPTWQAGIAANKKERSAPGGVSGWRTSEQIVHTKAHQQLMPNLTTVICSQTRA